MSPCAGGFLVAGGAIDLARKEQVLCTRLVFKRRPRVRADRRDRIRSHSRAAASGPFPDPGWWLSAPVGRLPAARWKSHWDRPSDHRRALPVPGISDAHHARQSARSCLQSRGNSEGRELFDLAGIHWRPMDIVPDDLVGCRRRSGDAALNLWRLEIRSVNDRKWLRRAHHQAAFPRLAQSMVLHHRA